MLAMEVSINMSALFIWVSLTNTYRLFCPSKNVFGCTFFFEYCEENIVSSLWIRRLFIMCSSLQDLLTKK